MQTIGIIGGISWVSSQKYYRLINELFNQRLGREASAEILLKSINFQNIINHQVHRDWGAANQIVVDAAHSLQAGGSDCFLIASNTMHTAFEHAAATVQIPGINIFDAISDSLKKNGVTKIGLIGTRYTMTMPFFKDAYRKHEITAVSPNADDAKIINKIIFKNLIRNDWDTSSRTNIRTTIRATIDRCIEQLANESDVTTVVLGCTELELLYPEFQRPYAEDYGWMEQKSGIKLIDSTRIHSLAAMRFALG